MKRIALVSLGCPKNLVDSEFILEQLERAGYTIVPDHAHADTVVVNTCAFLTEAVEESIETMLEFASNGKEVVCTGCLVSRYGEELLRELPEVTLFAAPGTYDGLASALRSGTRYLPACFSGVVRRSCRTTGPYAYVKVSEGCSNHCSYCLIPRIRGELVSKPCREIIDECRNLALQGVREIILVAQDLGSYGLDRANGIRLEHLVEKISLIDEVSWIRLMYMHPATTTGSVVKAMADNPKVVPYIDLPIQHVSSRVLTAMGRKGGSDAVRKAFDLLRSQAGDIWIRSTLMVGHPGEDERAFEELEDFVRNGYIDHLGVFAYSPEEGTLSSSLDDPLPGKVKEARRQRIMEIQQDISRKRLRSLLGKRIPVLVEGPHPETDLLLVGRSGFQAPEVDGTVIINDGFAPFGSFSEVEITGTMEYDLVGRIV
jgi:ribosomal protein S12 methylthiotransferase